ncbi:MSMEG_0565 family glycosyltransferase [Cryptosporangium arvum]|uniref:MSMEG_0565 family glycosyltransferase n=1 Tax=Cryptosporangium arvum TaxID=80871 RepID=UPI000567A940|nr:MSMEG_0565 family glycosyltransferase [Cryptosporangium arvum]
MRVALLTYSTKPRGGVVHTLALAEALAALDVDVTVWTLGRGGDGGFFRAVDPAVTVRVVPFEASDQESVGERILRSISTLRAAFDASRYDVVHAQDCISANAVRGTPYVRTVHHLDTFTTPELAACHERAIVEPAAHVCVSAAVAAEVHAGWGYSPTVIPNGVDAARFASADAGDPAGLGRYVLAVGGIEPRKGSIALLEAYAQLARPDVGLVFAGGETLFDYRAYRETWEARAAALGVAPIVLGPVGHEALPSLMASAAVFAFPSTKEGFGLAAMEALAAGVPVVTSDLPVLREVFGAAVRYAADVDALAAALADALDHGTDPDAGRALAARYTWAAAASAHLDFYRRFRGVRRALSPARFA